jgi:hypothetical protein
MIHEQTPPKHYQFGAYEILDTIGYGGMGVVYRAFDRNLGRAVALKILRDELRGESRVAARFQREAEAFGRLDHPHIVHVYSVGMVEQIPFIAMEYVEGETLACKMRREGVLDWREALRIGAQVAEALGSAHDAQIIHRDVKPGNILLDLKGRVRVTDFGIAKILNAATQLTTDGTRLGTPQYMCPERCQNQKVTHASDIYSLGVVLFQAITGRLPYDARSNVELVRQISAGEPKRLRDLVPEAPESVERLLAYMLEKSPAKRPASAQVLAATIERVLAGGSLDEQAEALANRLDQYRRSLPEASPITPDPDTPTRALEGSRWAARKARNRWFALPRAARLALAGVVAVTAAAAVASSLAVLTLRPAPVLSALDSSAAVDRWTQPLPTATLRPEASGVSLAVVDVPEFVVAGVSLTDASRLFLLLRGVDGSAREGQWTVLDGAGTVVVAPSKLSDESGVVLANSSEDAGLYALNHNGLRRFELNIESFTSLAAGAALWNTHVSAMTPSVTDNQNRRVRVAAQSTGGHGDWTLVVAEGSDLRRGAAITAPGAPIPAVSASDGLGVIAFLREQASGQATELRALLEGGTRELLLAEGPLSLAPYAVSPQGVVAYADARPEQAGVHIVQPAVHAGSRRMFAGTWPQWVGEGRLLFHDTDRLGHTQLFLASLDRPEERAQLTHFEGGVAASGAVLNDARTAVAVALPNGRSAALIDLGRAGAL